MMGINSIFHRVLHEQSPEKDHNFVRSNNIVRKAHDEKEILIFKTANPDGKNRTGGGLYWGIKGQKWKCQYKW